MIRSKKYIDRLNRLADAIENHSINGLGFNMMDWAMTEAGAADNLFGKAQKDFCGTTACIAGWAFALSSAPRSGKGKVDELIHASRHYSNGGVPAIAAEWLGLDREEAGYLFYGYTLRPATALGMGDVKPRHAAAVLRHLAKTGSVDWSVGAHWSRPRNSKKAA